MNNSAPVQASFTEEERYRLLVDAISDYAIYMISPEGRVRSWNSGAKRFKGYEAEEILGENFERFYTPEDRARGLPQKALRIAAEEGRFESEGWRVRKDGTHFWAHVVLDPIRASDGTLFGFAKITRDLTERRAAEETLRRSEELFKLLVEGVTDYAIYMLDQKGHVTSWNAGAQRIKGYAPAEIIGQHFSQFYTPEDRATGEPARALAQALREGRYEKEGWRIRKDGSRFWASVILDPIRSPNGELLGYAKITRDITERREAQLALDLAREQLLQAQKMEAVGQLTGGVAHDFNNLLTAILSSLELIRKRLPDDPTVLRLVDNAVQGVHRGATLTQRMLAFARRQPLKQEQLDVPRLVEGLVDLLGPSLGPTTRIDAEFPADLPFAVTDGSQLETAILNLCVNSRDAMPNGGTIRIAASAHDFNAYNDKGLAAGSYICVTVADSGEGMDEETLSKAMEPFFTTKGVGKGSGLGLSMVHGIAAQSGGALVLKSELGRGTTAELWLPSVAQREETAILPQETKAAGPAEQKLTVLAVDDDALVLMNTVMMLEDLGHRVHEATNGKAALQILQSEKVDLVISDHAMPGMTGSQLASAIAEHWPKTPVILATGYAELPPGASASLPRLSKPFSEKQLALAVAGAIIAK
ncbi:MAG TPA: PAS domain S-box protein [Devosiaceae bacterium]